MNRCRRRIQKARRRRGRITDAAAHAREVAARVMRKNFNPNRMPLWLRPQATWTDYCPEHAPAGVPMVHARVRTSTGEIGSVLLTREEYGAIVAGCDLYALPSVKARIDRDAAVKVELDAFLAKHAHLIPNDDAKK